MTPAATAVRTLGRTPDGREIVVVETEPHWLICITGAPVVRAPKREWPAPERTALSATGRGKVGR